MAKPKLVVVETKRDAQLKRRNSRSNERTIIKIIGSERSTSDFVRLQRTMFRGCTPGASLW